MRGKPRPAPRSRGPKGAPAPGACRDLRFAGASLTVRLHDCDAVLDALTGAIRGWVPQAAPAPDPDAPCTRVTRHMDRFAIAPAFGDNELSGLGAASAACAVIADLAQAFVTDRPGCVALHCGAVRFGAGPLILLAGPHRAGKSTLVARLTAEPDITVFTDDVLPVAADGTAMALGIAPRLRLPVPSTASEAFRRHVAAMPGPRDARYAYLAGDGIAPHGTQAPLDTLIVLDRRDQGPARLHRMDPDQALHHLLARNMGDLGCAAATFARTSALAAGLTCLRLVYAELEDATALLRHALSPDALPGGRTVPGPPLPDPVPDSRIAPVPASLVLRQTPGVQLRILGAGAFLWRSGDPTLWHLNPVGHAVWTLLAIPGHARDLAQSLAEVFPDQPPARMTRDIARLMAELLAEGFVTPA